MFKLSFASAPRYLKKYEYAMVLFSNCLLKSLNHVFFKKKKSNLDSQLENMPFSYTVLAKHNTKILK